MRRLDTVAHWIPGGYRTARFVAAPLIDLLCTVSHLFLENCRVSIVSSTVSSRLLWPQRISIPHVTVSIFIIGHCSNIRVILIPRSAVPILIMHIIGSNIMIFRNTELLPLEL